MIRILTRQRSAIAKIGLFLATLSVLSALGSGLGSRYDLWDFSTGLKIFKLSAYFGLSATAFSLISLILFLNARTSRSFCVALSGVIISIILVAVPLHWFQKAKSLPAIHDITTDTEDPPQFVAVLPIRQKALNPSVYGGESVASQQHRTYPDIAPLILNVPPVIAFDKTVEVVRRLGWKIQDADKTEGRVEATDTTFWFGFKDDIVIRIKKNDAGSRVDIRSVSRVGKSDLGANANRIRKFLAEMKKS